MTMGSHLAISIVLIMLAHLCSGGEILLKQTPVIHVSLAKENVTINCLATLSQEYLDTTVAIYNTEDIMVNDSPYNIVSKLGAGNTTQISFKFDIQPHTATNFYYCRTKEPQRRVRGTGTFIHVRDTGYIDYREHNWRRLRVFLITSCCILAVLSLAGTILLLFWKKKGYPIWSSMKANQENESRKGAVTSSSNRPETPTSGSIYATLQNHSIDVYDTVEQDIKQDIKNQLQVSTQLSPVLSPPKHKHEMKKNPERQSVGKKKAADLKTQPAAAQEIVDTVYENL